MKLRWPFFEFLDTFGTKVEPPLPVYIRRTTIPEAMRAMHEADLREYEARYENVRVRALRETPTEPEPKMVKNVVSINVKITDLSQFRDVVEALGPWLAEWYTTMGTSPAQVNLAKAIRALAETTEGHRGDDIHPVEVAQAKEAL